MGVTSHENLTDLPVPSGEFPSTQEVIENLLKLVDPCLERISLGQKKGTKDQFIEMARENPRLFFLSLSEAGQDYFTGIMDAKALHETARMIHFSEASDLQGAHELEKFIQGRAYLLDELAEKAKQPASTSSLPGSYME